AARAARYGALDAAASRHAAGAVLLAHHRDDQAEQVLLGLARGSGARSLSGMPAQRGLHRRPFLELSRATLAKAVAAQGLVPWHDPTNADPAHTRNRVRHDVLPALERALGPGIEAALARTARQLRDDADALDVLASDAERSARRGGGWDAEALAVLPAALRARVLRTISGGRATDVQVRALDALVTDWHGQGPVAVTGGARIERAGSVLRTSG
ncbi:MAG TPA: tRNA lysidine(34) synthetase TilS, partial [Mycobacteriales bacterium]|nr:tRNA lysidine(34) synthetase TilS [Mycobacteriales bacterium]